MSDDDATNAEHLHRHRDRLAELRDDPDVPEFEAASHLAQELGTPLTEDWFLWLPDGTREVHETCDCEWGYCPVRRVPHPSFAGAPMAALALQVWADDHAANVVAWECFNAFDHPEDRPFIAALVRNPDLRIGYRVMVELRCMADGAVRPVVTTDDGETFRYSGVGWIDGGDVARLPPTHRHGFPPDDERRLRHGVEGEMV